MKILNASLIMVALAASLLGCWKQHDEIGISGDGATAFVSEVTITEVDLDYKTVEEISNDYMNLLRRAGWQVEKTWATKTKPFKLSFKGSGNLKIVKNVPDFYVVKKIDEKSLRMWFIPAEARGGKSSRSITFNTALLGGAKVFDSHGQRVSTIEYVNSRTPYLVVFR